MTLALHGFRVGYEGLREPVLSLHSLEFPVGVNVLVGRNGAGKSSLLRGLTARFPGMIRTGTVSLNGQPLIYSRVGLVTQSAINGIVPELSFFENVLLASATLHEFLRPTIANSARNYAQILTWLGGLNLAEDAESLLPLPASRLSGGQQQLLAIIMRLIREPQLLLLDEFTANLDSANAAIVIAAVQKIARSGSVVLLATHQLELSDRLNATVYEVGNGNVLRKTDRPV